MKLYLDTCCLHRPVDDQSQARVALEAQAVRAIFEVCEAGKAALVWSDPLILEISRNRHPERVAFVIEALAKATAFADVDRSVESRAEELQRDGFKTLDALHLACAEASGVDYFCTCDDRLMKKARGATDLRVRVISPLQLAQEIVR